ncbi:hypothetical protein L596_013157 [Steinernema carpocapsae]|uniref:Secreted protein n=1 Tax=Steinernema carpocapsae TaxID=34508 RepID=A0A4U5NZH8_STECR|nr:hypothetical protein L596_013157 [Steinernema carpocapsae]
MLSFLFTLHAGSLFLHAFRFSRFHSLCCCLCPLLYPRAVKRQIHPTQIAFHANLHSFVSTFCHNLRFPCLSLILQRLLCFPHYQFLNSRRSDCADQRCQQ